MSSSGVLGLFSKAGAFSLRERNFQVLDADRINDYVPMARILQSAFDHLKNINAFTLPNMSAVGNKSIGVFSDYSGEGPGRYMTYSFLFCCYNLLDEYKRTMPSFRVAHRADDKEIAYKHFKHGAVQRLLPSYLQILNDSVPGLLFTISIEKTILSVNSHNDKAGLQRVKAMLEEEGFGGRNAFVSEKLLRISHIIGYVLGLIAKPSNKIFWMTDNDDICTTQAHHMTALNVLSRIASIYTNPPGTQYELFGGALPFNPRDQNHLDLLSASDVVAGTISAYLTQQRITGAGSAKNEQAAQVLNWLANDGPCLKKLILNIHHPPGGIMEAEIMGFRAVQSV